MTLTIKNTKLSIFIIVILMTLSSSARISAEETCIEIPNSAIICTTEGFDDAQAAVIRTDKTELKKPTFLNKAFIKDEESELSAYYVQYFDASYEIKMDIKDQLGFNFDQALGTLYAFIGLIFNSISKIATYFTMMLANIASSDFLYRIGLQINDFFYNTILDINNPKGFGVKLIVTLMLLSMIIFVIRSKQSFKDNLKSLLAMMACTILLINITPKLLSIQNGISNATTKVMNEVTMSILDSESEDINYMQKGLIYNNLGLNFFALINFGTMDIEEIGKERLENMLSDPGYARKDYRDFDNQYVLVEKDLQARGGMMIFFTIIRLFYTLAFCMFICTLLAVQVVVTGSYILRPTIGFFPLLKSVMDPGGISRIVDFLVKTVIWAFVLSLVSIAISVVMMIINFSLAQVVAVSPMLTMVFVFGLAGLGLYMMKNFSKMFEIVKATVNAAGAIGKNIVTDPSFTPEKVASTHKSDIDNIKDSISDAFNPNKQKNSSQNDNSSETSNDLLEDKKDTKQGSIDDETTFETDTQVLDDAEVKVEDVDVKVEDASMQVENTVDANIETGNINDIEHDTLDDSQLDISNNPTSNDFEHFDNDQMMQEPLDPDEDTLEYVENHQFEDNDYEEH